MGNNVMTIIRIQMMDAHMNAKKKTVQAKLRKEEELLIQQKSVSLKIVVMELLKLVRDVMIIIHYQEMDVHSAVHKNKNRIIIMIHLVLAIHLIICNIPLLPAYLLALF